MAVDVTIVSQYRDEDYFQSKNSALYAYSSVPSGGIGLSWSGNTANAVGTYGSATTIIAEPNFRFDAETDALFVGTIPTAHGSNAAYSMTLGTDTASEFGQFEFSGHQFIDGRLGGISFHNELATRSDKMVADFYVERNGANYTGNFHLDIANASHTMIPVYDVGYTQHEWWTNNISRMTLSITALYSEATADLGRTTDPWGYLYVSNIRDAALAGTGTRVVLADTDGDLTTSVLLFDGAALYPSVSGVDLGRDTDGERFQKIYREANDGHMIHHQNLYSNTPSASAEDSIYRWGGTIASPAIAPTDSLIQEVTGSVAVSGVLQTNGVQFISEVVGTVAPGNFTTQMTWAVRDGTSAMAVAMTLHPDLFTLVPPINLSSLSGTGIRMVTAAADGTLEADRLTITDDAIYGGIGTFLDLGLTTTGYGFGDMFRGADEALNDTQHVYTNTAAVASYEWVYRHGGTYDSDAVAPTDAVIKISSYNVQDTAFGYSEGALFTVGVDGTIADENFDTYMTWSIKDGAAAVAVAMSLYSDLFTVVPIVRLSNLAGTGSRMVVADAEGDLSTNALPIEMTWPDVGIALSTGSAWGTSITDNSSTWNAAQPGHANLTSVAGLTYASLSFVKMSSSGTFSLDTATYLTSETSHADVVVDGDFTANGMLRRTGAGAYASLTGSASVDTVETTLTDDDTHLPTSGAVYTAIEGAGGMVYPGAGIPQSSGSSWNTSLTGSTGIVGVQATLTDDATYLPTSAAVYAALSAGMTYPPGSGIPIVVSGSSWGTTITDSSTNWDAAYTHSQITGGNSVHVSTTENTQWDTAYTHSQITGGNSVHVSTTENTNWDAAYTHSGVTTGNPHSVEWTELDGARTSITLSGFDDDLTYNNYSHPNHSGHVTSTGDGATVLTVSAITGQSAITSGLDSDDEFVIQYDGSIRRMDVSVLQTYMQDNLAFNNYSHPNHTGHVTSTGDGAQVVAQAAITGQTAIGAALISTDELLVSDTGTGMRRMDISVLQTYMQAELTFGSGLWTDGGGYLTPVEGGDSVRTEGNGSGFFVDTATRTGIEAAGGGSSMNVYTNGTNISLFAATYQHLYGALNITHSTLAEVVISKGSTLTGYYRGDDRVDLDTNHVGMRSGNAGSGDSGHVYLHPGTSSGTRGQLYFGDGSSGGLQAVGTETDVVFYEPTTGLLTYGTGTGAHIQKGTTTSYSTGAEWHPIAVTNGEDRATAIISVFGFSNNRHGVAKFIISYHYGKGEITQIAGASYNSPIEFTEAALFYLTADQTGGGGRFAILLDAGEAVSVVIEDYYQTATHSAWVLYEPDSSGDVADMIGWTQFKTLTDVSDFTLATTGNVIISGEDSAAAGVGGILRLANTHTAVSTGNEAGRIEFYKADASTQAAGVVGKIYSECIDSGGTYNIVFATGQDVETPAGTNSTMTWSYTGYLDLATGSATGAPQINFYQATTKRAYISYVDSGDVLRLASEYGDMQFYTGTSGTEVLRMHIHQDGDISINASTAVTSGYRLEIFGTDNKGRAADWTATSDYHLKTKFQGYGSVLAGLESLWKSTYGLSLYNRRVLDDNNQPTEEYHEERELGFIAQEMLQVFPEIVSGSEEEFYDISYMRLGAIAAAGVAELKDLHDLEIADLNKRLEALENKLMNYGNDNN